MKDWQSQSHVKWYIQEQEKHERDQERGPKVTFRQTAPFRGLPHTTSSTGGADWALRGGEVSGGRGGGGGWRMDFAVRLD